MEVSNNPTVEDLDNLVAQYRAIDDCIEEQEAQTKVMREQKDKIAAQLMGILKHLGRSSYKCEAGTFTRVEKYRVTIPKTEEEKQAFFKWLEENGKFMQYATVNSNSLNSLYTEEWEAVKESGDPEAALNFRIPGVSEPKLTEHVSFRRN